MILLWAAFAAAGVPEELLSQARAAEREGRPVVERELCRSLVQEHARSPQAQACQARLEALESVSEHGSLQAYQVLEQARRAQVPASAVVPLLESPNAVLASQARQWLAQSDHQSAVYAKVDARRRVLSWISGVSLALMALLSWPLGRGTWARRPRLVGAAIWGALCVPTLALVQLYGGLSPRVWAVLPAGAGVFVLSAGPAAALKGPARVLWGGLCGLGALGSSFLVLRWAQALHWVGL